MMPHHYGSLQQCMCCHVHAINTIIVVSDGSFSFETLARDIARNQHDGNLKFKSSLTKQCPTGSHYDNYEYKQITNLSFIYKAGSEHVFHWSRMCCL
jgi:hypothetical protein